MSKTIIISLVLAASVAGVTAASARGSSASSLLGALVTIGHHGSSASSSLANLAVNVPGVARANVAVGRQRGRASTLLGISATVLDGGVGHQNRW